MGVENLYSDFKDAALFDYLTYLCFLLSGQKSLSNIGGWGEGHRFAVSALSGPTFCDSISPSVKWGQLLSRCWTCRKGRQICCSGELILERDLSHAVVWKSTLMFEEHLVLEALGEWGSVNICTALHLWMQLHPCLVCCWCGVLIDPEPSLSRSWPISFISSDPKSQAIPHPGRPCQPNAGCNLLSLKLVASSTTPADIYIHCSWRL